MPRPSCQRILIRLPLTPLKTNRSPAWGSRRSASWTCRARPFMPRRMSVRPTASQTRTPDGTGIIAAPVRRARAAVSAYRPAADEDTVPAGKINLDRLRDVRRLRVDSILFRLDHHRDQSRSRRHGRRTRVVAIALPPTKYLVRIHLVMPGNL